MTTAMAVAAYLKRNQRVFGNMQLQKLLYYSQAWNLAWTGRPLFTDEIEAWPNGPVVRTVWAVEKYREPMPEAGELTDDERAVVDAVFAFYGNMGGAVLGKMTHEESPWLEARDGLAATAPSSAAISQGTMRRYFTVRSSNGQAGPTAPVRVGQAAPAMARAAGNRQAARWREALDALAER